MISCEEEGLSLPLFVHVENGGGQPQAKEWSEASRRGNQQGN